MKNVEIGKIGEEIAQIFLISQNYVLLVKNYRWRGGEIDLIAKKKSQIIFFEVKTRRDSTFGELYETISARKRDKLIKTALHFLADLKIKSNSWRIDLIGVKLNKKLKAIKIIHIKNAI